MSPRIANEDNREKILEAAYELFIHYGFKKTTVEDIAEKCEIGKGSVYLHFKTKQDILTALHEDRANRIIGGILKARDLYDNLDDQLRYMIRQRPLEANKFVRMSKHAQDLVGWDVSIFSKNCCVPERILKLVDQYIDAIAQVITEGNRQGIYNCPKPREWADNCVWSSMSYMPPFALIHKMERIEVLVDGYCEIFIEALKNKEK